MQQYTSFSFIWCLHLAIDSLCKGHLEKCKQNLEISTLTSEQIVGLRECWLSNLSDISLEWVVHFGRNMSDLRVWSLNHLECTVFSLPEPTWIVCLVFKQYSFHKEGLAPWSSLDLAFPLQTSRNLLRSCQSFGLTDTKILSVRKIFWWSGKKSSENSRSCA